ncbi:MAG: ABC transporter ATP-binding protein [Candidatus Brocadiae bacterium]|nr:ABC transporter ATP-binding protein [Candidatus Brocadiia bacterium]
MSKKDPSQKLNFAIYLRILGYLKKYLKLVAVCLVLSFFISFFHFGSLGMVKPLGDFLFTPGAAEKLIQFLNQYGEWGIKTGEFLKTYVLHDTYKTLYIIMFAALVMVILKNILRFLQEYISGYITSRVSIDITNDLFKKVQKLPIQYFSKEGVGQISSRFMNDIPIMTSGLKSVFEKAIREPLKAVASICLALFINWYLTLLSFLIFPVVAVCLRKLGKKVKRGAKKALSQQASLVSILQETFSGIKIVKSYQMEDLIRQKFERENNGLFRYHMKLVAADAATNPLMEVFVTLSGIGVMLFSAHMVIQQKMSMGDFFAFYAALAAVFDPIRKLSDINNRINTAIAGGERVFELMDKFPEIQDAPGAIELPCFQQSIRWDRVWFSYEPGKPVLKDISFTVQKGEKIAIVGRSGSGKSTLVSLLLRLYDVNQGTIFLDGYDIRKITMQSLLRQIGIVTQEAFLFNDTIAANISCKKENIEMPKIIEAARAANSDVFIESLSQKYDTIYGPRGIDLSGGQKHRVALARAIFKSPQILILDEAMANLDAESESYILSALEEFSKGRTTFIIAHRFSTIEKVDKILVLDEGNLVGFGNHRELMEKSDVYRNLYNRQVLGLHEPIEK